MKRFHNIMANIITGAIIGEIFLLPFLGWLYSGHGLIEFDWTKRFFVVGLVWGIACGIAVGLVPTMLDSKIPKRVLIGIVVGGLSGMIFYLIGDLAFPTEDSLVEIFSKSLVGGLWGAISGGVSALTLDIINWLLRWVSINREIGGQENQGKKPQLKKRILSGLVGLVTGMVIGGFLLVLFGQMALALLGFLFFYMIIWFYFLPIMIGFFLAVYGFVKTLQERLLKKSIDGLRHGITFSLLFILYYELLSYMILHSSLPKPEVMTDNLWLDFVPAVVVVFTTLFGLFAGITGATFEGFFFEWRDKVKKES